MESEFTTPRARQTSNDATPPRNSPAIPDRMKRPTGSHYSDVFKRSLSSPTISKLAASPAFNESRIYDEYRRLAQDDKRTDRLVDQFYEPSHESGNSTKNGSVNEVSKMLHSTKAKFNEGDVFPDNINQQEFNRILKQGGFEFYDDDILLDDENLNEYIAKVDNMFEEWHNNGTDISNIPVHLPITDISHESLNQLIKLSDYLKLLHDEISGYLTEFSTQKHVLKAKFTSDITEKVDKLNDLKYELNFLDVKLSKLKATINHNKSILQKDVPEKLKILESIEQKINFHSRATNSKRFNNIKIILTGFMVIYAIYYYYYIWRI